MKLAGGDGFGDRVEGESRAWCGWGLVETNTVEMLYLYIKRWTRVGSELDCLSSFLFCRYK